MMGCSVKSRRPVGPYVKFRQNRSKHGPRPGPLSNNSQTVKTRTPSGPSGRLGTAVGRTAGRTAGRAAARLAARARRVDEHRLRHGQAGRACAGTAASQTVLKANIIFFMIFHPFLRPTAVLASPVHKLI